jgi:hypothetical protein
VTIFSGRASIGAFGASRSVRCNGLQSPCVRLQREYPELCSDGAVSTLTASRKPTRCATARIKTGWPAVFCNWAKSAAIVTTLVLLSLEDSRLTSLDALWTRWELTNPQRRQSSTIVTRRCTAGLGTIRVHWSGTGRLGSLTTGHMGRWRNVLILHLQWSTCTNLNLTLSELNIQSITAGKGT